MPTTLSEKAKKVKSSSTLAITAKAKELKAKGEDVVSFGAGEPDFPTPENICEAAIQAIENGATRYTPASGTNELKKAISKKFYAFNKLDYKPNQIVVSNGGKHSLTNIFEAILNEGDEVIIPAPYWLSYPEIVRLAGGVPVFVRCTREQDYKLTIDQLAAAVTDKTKALVLNTPNNPTGMIYGEEELRAIGNFAVEHDFFIVADEMYENLFYGEEEHVSIASLSKEIYKKTITCSGVSKSYAMTGWRIGYTGSTPDIAALMSSIQSHQTSNPCSISQAAAVEALNGPQYTVAEMHRAFDKRRKFIYKRVNEMPLVSAVEPKGAFYLFVDCSQVVGKEYKGKTIENAADMAAILIEDFKVAVVPCGDFGFDDHIRLSYATSTGEITKGLERIESFLNLL
ncbi:MAG: pyridoxal phosphate-dependent aminotransferase [Lachnospiraceae bacterium]|uniref:Aminotransferase n=1 Tax=Hominifimenecus microfluidus TaxID=2885348 RepID=A0AAE3JG02_9FIRM|nr:pyridoxal phosphate-dependent aminotransferase [Hominifimenecus microfluidus]MCC2231292.1 pyridoxal phosphate-dependent aminotransferase [Hominifimenecus microfluidus]